MLSQGTQQKGDVRIVDDQDIKDVYQKLGIGSDSEENRVQPFRGFDRQRDYWPPIPEYSVRFCTDEDLNY